MITDLTSKRTQLKINNNNLRTNLMKKKIFKSNL